MLLNLSSLKILERYFAPWASATCQVTGSPTSWDVSNCFLGSSIIWANLPEFTYQYLGVPSGLKKEQ
jgi:hypothetical protein